MAIITCPECGGKVSSNARACPHCGNIYLNNSNSKGGYLGFFIIIIPVFIYMVFRYCGDSPISYHKNVWCGELTERGVIILKQDIAKEGSTICLSDMSSKDSEHIPFEIEMGSLLQNPNIRYKKIIFEGKIKDKKFVNVDINKINFFKE